MRYLILGPLEVRDGARAVPLGQGHQRVLLAALLLQRNEVVSSDRLIDLLWGEAPPPSAAGSLHNLVSALRKGLGDGQLVTHGSGYALSVGAGELDAEDFEALAARGRAALADGDAKTAAARLREALALWRGPALSDLAYERAVAPAAARLEDLRLSAVEDRIDADLALGRHAALVTELAELVERHPARERLRGEQMLALYRCDRQTEALAAYQDFRRVLWNDLGLAPAPALCELERAILEHDSALAAPRRPAATARRPRRLTIVAVAALSIAAVAALVLRDGESGSARPGTVRASPDSLTVIDPATNAVVASYPVGATPMSASVGGGAAWTVSADAQTISRIDLRERTTRMFATGSVPLEVAAGADALWLLAADGAEADGPFGGSPATLARIDPGSAAVAATTPLEPRGGPGTRIPPGLIALSDTAVWTIGRDGRLTRLDRRSGRKTTARGLRAFTVAAGDGQLWAVVEADPAEPNLVRLDPLSGRVLARVRVPWASIAGVAVGAGAVWVTDPYAGVVWRIDPGPQPVQRTVTVDYGVDSVAAAGGSVWAANSVTGTVSRIDPGANRVAARVAVGGTPRSVALGAGRVWVAVAGDERAAAGSLPDGATLQPLRVSGCGPAVTAPGASPDLLVAADLPLQGRFTASLTPTAAAIAFVLREHRFRAGRFRLALQTCDDSLAQSGSYDAGKCRANAKAYAGNPDVIGVVGPINSGCTEAMLPVLNRAPGGPVSIVSPFNSQVQLTRAAPGFPAGFLRTLYPTGQRGYSRVYPADDAVMAATAVALRDIGARRVFYTVYAPAVDHPWGVFLRRAARRNGVRIVGTAAWDPEAAAFHDLARRVRASRAQAVVVNGSIYANVGRVVRDLRRVLGPDFPIFATEEALPVTQLFAEAGDAARGVRFVIGGLQPTRLDAAGRRFVRAFGATQHGGRVSQLDVYAAAATEVLLDAIARSDGTRESVARALATTRLAEGPLGPLALDRRGEPLVTHATVIRAERGGAQAYIDGVEGGAIERVITLPAPGATSG